MFNRRVFENPTVSMRTGTGTGIGAGIALTLLASGVAAYFYKRLCSHTNDLPAPSARKQNPGKLDRMHDRAVEDSMAASDPPSTSMPEVR